MPQTRVRRLCQKSKQHPYNIKNCGTEALLHCFCAAVVIANCRCRRVLLHHLNHLAVLTANDVDALLHGLKLTTREVVDCAIG